MAAARRKKPAAARSQGLLYLLVFLVLLAAWAMVMTVKVSNAPVIRLHDVLPLAAMGGCCVFVWLVVKISGFQGDRMLPPLVLLLAGLGLMVQFRLGNLDLYDVRRASTVAYALGLVSFIATWMVFRRGRHAILAGLALPCLLLSAGLMGAILLLGERFRGAVYLGGQFNPAEAVKLLLVIFLAGVITDFRKPLQQTVAGLPAPPAKSLVTLTILWAIPMALLVAQRDLGMIILLNMVLLVLLFMVTGKWGYLLFGLAAAVLVGYVGFQMFDHARARFFAWQDPFADPTGRGWQILQSLSAMFSGGLWGSGLGSGAPTVVPIAASDFVYAALAEELGYVGCALVVAVYLLLFYRGYRVADQMKQPFDQALAAGITTMLALQTIMNIGGVTKAIPLTGITLPLISHGGSSLVTSLVMLGLLVAVSEPPAVKRSGRG